MFPTVTIGLLFRRVINIRLNYIKLFSKEKNEKRIHIYILLFLIIIQPLFSQGYVHRAVLISSGGGLSSGGGNTNQGAIAEPIVGETSGGGYNMKIGYIYKISFNVLTITTSATGNGSISPASPTVGYGTNQIFSITRNSGETIINVTTDGVSVGTPSSYTFSNVTSNHNLSATFSTTSQQCSNTVTLHDPITLGPVEVFKAKFYLIAAGSSSSMTIPSGKNVSFIAGTSVKLLPGFHAYQSCSFTAKIQTNPCGGKITIPQEEILSQKESQQEVRIYPNPNYGIFNIDILGTDNEKVTIVIRDLSGSPVLREENLKGNLFAIDLSRNSKGIYFVNVLIGNKQFVGKIIIQ